MMADDPATSARLLSLPGARGPASSAQSACPFFERIAVKRFSHEEAKGPTWARAQDTDMLRDEHEFCLRTDSHMAFVKDWDVLQLRQWADAQNEYAILST